MLFEQALLFVLPVIVGGAVHIFAIRLGLWPRLARLPLDGGLGWRGRRLLGDNKTVRGAVVMTAATALASGLVGLAVGAHGLAARGLAPAAAHPLAWGALLGAGYVAGELPNSFLKRQLDVAPGAAARGPLRPLFWIVDQCDSLVGVLAAVSLVAMPPLALSAVLVAVTIVVHPLAALVMKRLGLKSRVG
jgi:hypothetical protein